jgi:hypothetical protein
MKVQTGLKAGRQGLVETLAHGGRTPPVGKGGV